jgi:tetratricopeptide (TPR) repeat protein
MDNMEYIDDYFKSSPGDEQKQRFEQRIINDISFAEEVAFYISANGAVQEQLQEEKKQRFREIYKERKVAPVVKMPFRKILRYMAAASVVAAIILSISVFTGEKISPQQLADQYINQKLDTLSVTMSVSRDSLQTASVLFNAKKFKDALAIFEALAQNHPENNDVKKYAGVAYLRLEQYDKALAYFSQLAANTSLYSNYGKFYEALTLMKRNKTGDVDAAKKLLQDVLDNAQEGKEDAGKWLKKMK